MLPSRTPRSPAPRTETALTPWQQWLFDYGPVLLLMLLMFIASTDLGSSAHTGSVLHHLLAWMGLAGRFTLEQIEAINHTIRKAGHVTEYAVLGVLVHRAVARGRVRWSARPVVIALVTVALYASLDELHQRFIPSRTSSGWDVLIDIAGGLIGLGLKWSGEERWRVRSSG